MEDPAVRDIATGLIRRAVASRDGYTARDMLAHDPCAMARTPQETSELTVSLKTSALDSGAIPEPLLARLMAALDISAAVLGNEQSSTLACTGPPPAATSS